MYVYRARVLIRRPLRRAFFMDITMQKILDPMSGARMFYFDKKNKSVLFGDIRDETHWTRQYKKLEIHPDQLMDARKLDFPDETFYLVVLDPPQLINSGKT